MYIEFTKGRSRIIISGQNEEEGRHLNSIYRTRESGRGTMVVLETRDDREYIVFPLLYSEIAIEVASDATEQLAEIIRNHEPLRLWAISETHKKSVTTSVLISLGICKVCEVHNAHVIDRTYEICDDCRDRCNHSFVETNTLGFHRITCTKCGRSKKMADAQKHPQEKFFE